MRLFYKNKALDAAASLHTGSDNALYPLAGIVNGLLHPEARVTTSASNLCVIRFDFGNAVQIQGVLIAGTNIHDMPTELGLHYNSTDDPLLTGTATALLSINDFISSGHYLNGIAAAPASARYWYFYIKTANPNTEYRIGELWLVADSGTLPVDIMESGAVDDIGGEFSEFSTRGGIVHTAEHWRGRNFERLAWRDLSAAEAQTFRDLHERRFPNGSLWFDYSVNGNMDFVFARYRNKSLPVKYRDPGYFDVTLTIHEHPEPDYDA